MGALKHKTAYTIVLEHDQLAALRKLAEETRVPLQVLLREAVNLLLEKHARRKTRR